MATNGTNGQTYLQLGWTGPHINFGSGYDVAQRALRSSAFDSFPKPEKTSDAQQIKTNNHTISTSEELKTRIKADVKATIPLDGVSVETENSYLREVQISGTSLTHIIQESIEDERALVDTSKLKLSKAALDLLDSPGGVGKFQEKYGEYFVYGAMARSRFSAICNVKTKTTLARDKIKSSLEVQGSEVGSLKATIDAFSKSSDESISIDIIIDFSGVKSHMPEETKPTKVEEVRFAYETFKKNYVTNPYVGMLCHYSVIDSRLPLPQQQFQHLGPELERLYQSLYMSQTELLASPMKQAADFTPKISALCDEIKMLKMSDSNAINQLKLRVENCTTEANNWRLRSDLVEDVKKLKNEKLNPGDWIEGFNTTEWSSGLLGVAGNPKYDSLVNDVKYQSQWFEKEWELAKYLKGTYTLGSSEALVIGFKINNSWADGTNGWFKMHDGNVLDSHVEVEFCSYKTRGCKWGVEAWTVNKLTYDKIIV